MVRDPPLIQGEVMDGGWRWDLGTRVVGIGGSGIGGDSNLVDVAEVVRGSGVMAGRTFGIGTGMGRGWQRFVGGGNESHWRNAQKQM